MRLYEVQLGDSPASIAAAHAGCPKCSRDLVALHSHRASIVHKNGYRTFKKPLRAGEKIALPDRWFDGSMDHLPPTYFAALPHPDGITSSKLGVHGLEDQAQLDVAAAKVGRLAAMGDQPFSAAVDDTAFAIDISVREVDEGIGAPALYAAPFAQAARASTAQARQRNAALVAVIAAGDLSAGAPIRNAILKDFSNALGSAGLALQAFYGDPAQVQVDIGQATIDPTPTSAARAAAAAIGADPNYCMSVAQPRSPVNVAVHAFKTAWNSANPSAPVPINTSTYEQATADAITRVLGTAPAACGGGRVTPETPFSPLVVTPPQPRSGLGVGAILGIGLLGAGAVGGAIYLATRHPIPRQRTPRVRRVRPGDFS